MILLSTSYPKPRSHKRRLNQAETVPPSRRDGLLSLSRNLQTRPSRRLLVYERRVGRSTGQGERHKRGARDRDPEKLGALASEIPSVVPLKVVGQRLSPGSHHVEPSQRQLSVQKALAVRARREVSSLEVV